MCFILGSGQKRPDLKQYRISGLTARGAPPPRAAPPGRLEPWWVPSFPLLVIPEASWTLIFYIIFLEYLGYFKYRENLKYKNSKKQELTLGCTELIGSSKYD